VAATGGHENYSTRLGGRALGGCWRKFRPCKSHMVWSLLGAGLHMKCVNNERGGPINQRGISITERPCMQAGKHPSILYASSRSNDIETLDHIDNITWRPAPRTLGRQSGHQTRQCCDDGPCLSPVTDCHHQANQCTRRSDEHHRGLRFGAGGHGQALPHEAYGEAYQIRPLDI
jgi:hypothetical protein